MAIMVFDSCKEDKPLKDGGSDCQSKLEIPLIAEEGYALTRVVLGNLRYLEKKRPLALFLLPGFLSYPKSRIILHCCPNVFLNNPAEVVSIDGQGHRCWKGPRTSYQCPGKEPPVIPFTFSLES